MPSFSAMTPDGVRALFDEIKRRVRGHACVADASQQVADVLYEHVAEGAVLARVFATVEFAHLPAAERDFVLGLLAGKGLAPTAVTPKTPVLCLLGTRGDDPAWNRRELSRGHRAIPLLGTDFVASIPMVARMLKELGVAIQGLDGGAGRLSSRVLGSLSSIFYVEDAAEARGRNIIGDQEFVRTHGVRSVFGSGGAFMMELSMAVILVFAREHVPRAAAERFAPLVSVFKTGTMALASEGRFFPS